MNISVFGTWYVGLVTGTCLAEIWHEVMCVDIDQQKIDNLQKGILPIYEPGLEELVLRNYKEWRLRFTTDAQEAIAWWKAIFSAVGTPPDKDHRADLQYVKAVATTVATHMQWDKVFINKSTVPVGTWAKCATIMADILAQRGVSYTVSIVSNPEFLKEGTAVKDFMTPDRIVCGVHDEYAKQVMNDIYRVFTRADKPLLFTDVKSSELIKYAANAFLATKISFINEIANYAEIIGADVSAVARGIGLDHRIGPKFLHAGIWYGWSCFPKDVEALRMSWEDAGYRFQIIEATEKVNQSQKLKVIEKLHVHMPDLQGKTVALRWLAFKPKTDDVREAPSLYVCDALEKQWVAAIQVFDPVAMESFQRMYGVSEKITYVDRSYDALLQADALLLLTERDEFRNVDLKKVERLMVGKLIIDGRNIWHKDMFTSIGWTYEGIGK